MNTPVSPPVENNNDNNKAKDYFAKVANSQAGKVAGGAAPLCAEYLSKQQAQDWQNKGYFVLRGLVDNAECQALNQHAIDLIRQIDQAQSGEKGAQSKVKFGAISLAEKNFSTDVKQAEDRASKLYNLHRRDGFRQFSRNKDLVACLGGILGPDVDVFNSQYIFKNPGAWGQPWHQDSLYFDFNKSPQVGVWLATSKATIDNGCLYVADGSHAETIHEHLPDSRPDANVGYLEIRDYDFSDELPLQMEAGDVLIFHSALMHKSVDNNSDKRRTALVYHYTQAGTKNNGLIKSPTIDWMEVLRNHQPIAVDKKNPVRQWINNSKLSLLFRLMKLVQFVRAKN